jgi:PAS domain S-box-containing protein
VTLAELAPSVDRGLDLIAETAGRVLGADRVTVTLADDDGRFRPRAVWGGGDDGWRRVVLASGEGITGRVLATGGTIVLDRIDEPDVAALLPGVRSEGGRTALGVPIAADGRTVGVLIVVWKRDVDVDAAQTRLAEALAHHAATVLENARVADRERTLRTLTQALAAHLDEGTVLELAVQHAARLLRAPFARVWLLEADQWLRCAAAVGYRAEETRGQRMAPPNLALLAAQGRVVNVPDATAHPDWPDAAGFRARSSLRACLGAPIRRGGEPLGAVMVMREPERPFGAEDEALLVAIADAAAVAVANARVYRAAQHSERRYRALFEESKDPVFITTTDARFIELNPAGMELFGIGSREELAETTVIELYDDPAEREKVIGGIAANGFVRDCDVRMHRRSGERLQVQVTATAVRDAEGELVGYRGSLRDVTEARRAEAALRDAEERALQAAKLRALGQMASGIAHDLNQALGLVVGHGELALRQLEAPRPWLGAAPSPERGMEAARDSLRVIVKAAIDGADTVKRLLAFSRAQPEGEAERVDLGALLSDAAKLTAPRWRDDVQAEGRRISMSVETDGDTTVAGWPASLRETLANLIFNAVDALPQGGTIRLSARRQGDRVVAEVTDDGVGILPEVQARVFEPFFTTKGEKGTGLGLAVVFGIVERHGGTIAVESRTGGPERGTTFRISLPAVASGAVQPAAPAPELAAAQTPRLRILAVDDEPELRDMVALMLRNDGHDVRVAAGGDDALATLAEGHFDVMISDVGMPGMTGWELAERARQRWPALRCVLATGWGAEIDLAEAHKRGIEAVLAKPFRFNDLRRVLVRSV